MPVVIADFTLLTANPSQMVDSNGTRLVRDASPVRLDYPATDWLDLATAPATYDGANNGDDILDVLGLNVSTHLRLINQGARTLRVRLKYPSTYNTITPVVATTTPGGTGVNEVQTVTIPTTATGGTYTLTYSGQTTGAIAYNANAATVQTALLALSNLDTGDVVVSGGPGGTAALVITFGGTLAETNVGQITATGSLTGAAVVAPVVQVFGVDGNSLPIRLKTLAAATGATLTPTVASDVVNDAGDYGYTDFVDFDITGCRNILIGIKTKLTAPGITTGAAIQALAF